MADRLEGQSAIPPFPVPISRALYAAEIPKTSSLSVEKSMGFVR